MGIPGYFNKIRIRGLFRFLIFSVLIILSINWSKDCEEFDYDIIQWLPYNESDNILLSNSDIVETLVLDTREITHTDGYPMLSCCACTNSFSLGCSSTNLKIRAFFYDSRSYTDSWININNEHLIYSRHLDSSAVNGKEYYDILVYVNFGEDQSKNFNKIMIAKNIGILTIIGTDGAWTITDDTLREANTKEIFTIIDDC